MCSSKALSIFSRHGSIEQTVQEGALWYYVLDLLSHVDNIAQD